MQMKNSPLFTGPRHFLTVPLTSTRRITVRQVTNESCIIFTVLYFPQDVEGPLSSPFSPPLLLFSFLFLSPSRFPSRRAAGYPHLGGIFRKSSFHFHVVICALENSNGIYLSTENRHGGGGLLKEIINARSNFRSGDLVVHAVNLSFVLDIYRATISFLIKLCFKRFEDYFRKVTSIARKRRGTTSPRSD